MYLSLGDSIKTQLGQKKIKLILQNLNIPFPHPQFPFYFFFLSLNVWYDVFFFIYVGKLLPCLLLSAKFMAENIYTPCFTKFVDVTIYFIIYSSLDFATSSSSMVSSSVRVLPPLDPAANWRGPWGEPYPEMLLLVKSLYWSRDSHEPPRKGKVWLPGAAEEAGVLRVWRRYFCKNQNTILIYNPILWKPQS